MRVLQRVGLRSGPSVPLSAGSEQKHSAATRYIQFHCRILSFPSPSPPLGGEVPPTRRWLAIRGGRRNKARCPQTGDFITNVSARRGEGGLFHRRHDELGTFADAGRPACRDRLQVGIE